MSEKFFIGDIIVDNFGIYEITDIKTDPEIKGKSDLVYYTSVLKGEKKYVSYIPASNFKKAGMRRIISSSEALSILEEASKNNLKEDYIYNIAKDEVYFNDPQKSLDILRYVWINKDTLSTVDKELMEKILENLSREIAFATSEDQNKTKEEITKRLSKLN